MLLGILGVPEMLHISPVALGAIGAAVISSAGVARLLFDRTTTSAMVMDATAVLVGTVVAAALALGAEISTSADGLAAMAGTIGTFLSSVRAAVLAPPAEPTA